MSFRFRARQPGETVSQPPPMSEVQPSGEQDHSFGHEMMKRMSQVVIHRRQATRQQMLSI
jgi:hypothetical protein